MDQQLRDNLTPARLSWLKQLRDVGPAKRRKGRVAFDCMRLGWTEWVDLPKDPRERITPSGEAKLKEAGYDR